MFVATSAGKIGCRYIWSKLTGAQALSSLRCGSGQPEVAVFH